MEGDSAHEFGNRRKRGNRTEATVLKVRTCVLERFAKGVIRPIGVRENSERQNVKVCNTEQQVTASWLE